MATNSPFATFATSVGALKPITPSVGNRGHTIFQKLRSLDLFLVYWMGPAIAHTIMSFGFEDGRYLDFSIELRRT